MKRVIDTGQSGFACLLYVSFLVWSIAPFFTHAPTVFETIQDHLEMVEDHGHSPGFEEDLSWALHGHSHDLTDHDHSHAFLLTGYKPVYDPAPEDRWRIVQSAYGPSRQFRIDRPPRA